MSKKCRAGEMLTEGHCVKACTGENGMVPCHTDRDMVRMAYPESDMTLAVELELYAENDYDIYRQRLCPWQKNFGRKTAAGKFNRKLAVGALADHLAKDVQTKYFKEVGGSSAPEMDKATKMAFAELMLNSMEEGIKDVSKEIKNGTRNKLGDKKGENPPGIC